MAARLYGATMPAASKQNIIVTLPDQLFQEGLLRSTTRAADQVNNGAFSQISACTQPCSPPDLSRQQFRRSRDDPVPVQDPPERSPPPTRFCTAVKEERTLGVNAECEMPKPPHILKAEPVASNSMSIDHESIRSPPTKYTRLTSLRPDLFLNQCELCQNLEDIYTAAAGNFWRCQTHSAHDRAHILRSATNHSRNYRRFDSYPRSTQPAMTNNRYADQQESELSPMNYLFRIVDLMREQTKQANSERFELIHRMGNLFSGRERSWRLLGEKPLSWI